MSIDAIVDGQKSKLDRLLSSTIVLLERVEGPNCNRYPPEFNAGNHPYWSGVEFGVPGNSLFGLFLISVERETLRKE